MPDHVFSCLLISYSARPVRRDLSSSHHIISMLLLLFVVSQSLMLHTWRCFILLSHRASLCDSVPTPVLHCLGIPVLYFMRRI